VGSVGQAGSASHRSRPVLTVRLPPVLRSDIEKWAKQQHDKPSRSEAIRRLIEFALAVKAKRQNTYDK
jgi:metal-responsive CopG/Arc/MetJ family transcriptional regulator